MHEQNTAGKGIVYQFQFTPGFWRWATGTRLAEYDLAVSAPMLPTLFQKALKEVEKTDVYSSEKLQSLQAAIDQAQPLLNKTYDQSWLEWDDPSPPREGFFYHKDGWTRLNTAADSLRQALDALSQA